MSGPAPEVLGPYPLARDGRDQTTLSGRDPVTVLENDSDPVTVLENDSDSVTVLENENRAGQVS